jgi:hypothetical protein
MGCMVRLLFSRDRLPYLNHPLLVPPKLTRTNQSVAPEIVERQEWVAVVWARLYLRETLDEFRSAFMLRLLFNITFKPSENP